MKEVDRFFPQEILLEGFKLLKTKSGWVLIGLNFLFFLVFGFVTLVAGIIILGPAAMLLREPHMMSGILVFFLSLIFIEIVVLFVILEQFVILACLQHHFLNKKPIFSMEAFKNDGPRFMLYVKSCLFVLVKVCVGLLMLIVPGIQAFFRYMFVGPISVFEYGNHKTSDDILRRSEELTYHHWQQLASLFVMMCVLLFVLNFLEAQK